MPAEPVATVEARRIGGLEPLHACHQVWLRGLQQQMVMVAHQNISMHPPAGAPAGFRQCGEKPLPIIVVAKDRLAPVSAVEHGVNA